MKADNRKQTQMDIFQAAFFNSYSWCKPPRTDLTANTASDGTYAGVPAKVLVASLAALEYQVQATYAVDQNCNAQPTLS